MGTVWAELNIQPLRSRHIMNAKAKPAVDNPYPRYCRTRFFHFAEQFLILLLQGFKVELTTAIMDNDFHYERFEEPAPAGKGKENKTTFCALYASLMACPYSWCSRDSTICQVMAS